MLKHAKKPVGKIISVIPLYVLSDSTGNLAKHMVTTFLTQFPVGTFRVQSKPFIGEPRRLADALKCLGDYPGVVLHAVVEPELKNRIARRCEQLKISCCDLTGPTVHFLAKASHLQPLSDQQLLHPVDPVYCDRINAISFTLEHDDGLGLESLAAADVVLAGVSRTGKTPVSIYLAMQGYRVANISLAAQAPVPPQLLDQTHGKLVGLMIDAFHLVEIRGRRQAAWHMPGTSYNDPNRVEEELEWSRGIFKNLGCPIVDVTDQAIEETAARVLDLLKISEPLRHLNVGLS